MRHAIALSVLAFLLAGCGKDEGGSSSSSSSGPSARRISGGTETRFKGIVFDIPSNWKSQAQGDALVLAPDGANSTGSVEEFYLMGADTAVTSLSGEAMEQSLAKSAAQLQPGATKKSGPDSATFGALEGRKWVWSAKAQNGKDVEVRAWGWMGTSGSALIALGFPDVLAKREKDVEAILASMSKPAAPASGGGGGGIAQELCGQWIWFSNFTANNGGGSQTNTWILLEASGRYKWHYDSVSTNPNGAAWGSEDETGTWSAAEGTISFRPDRGNPYTQALVKRNHPKNVGDPMIVLDGKAYVTATNRPAWR
ncbi:MAG: hypothetical protein FD180_2556 [Planctomycetota bacterium]|nr:MAG: hypothetical protein FD180_2556 [Planctomycetota bacterium]